MKCLGLQCNGLTKCVLIVVLVVSCSVLVILFISLEFFVPVYICKKEYMMKYGKKCMHIYNFPFVVPIGDEVWR